MSNAALLSAGTTGQESHHGESPANAIVGGVDSRDARTVMVATDGSQRSLKILPHATAFASQSGATIRLVQILPSEGSAASAAMGRAGHRETIVYSRGRSESLAEAIERVASELHTDLIAMHSEHAHSSVHHAFPGSVTLDVLAQTHLPLLVSGPSIGATVHDSRRFVVATDGTPQSDQALLRHADWLIDRSFEVTLMEVYLPRLGDAGDRQETQNAAERLNRLKQSLTGGEASLAVECVPDPRQIERRIIEKALEVEALGIAVSTEAHRRLRHIVLGSISMAILGKSPLPLLLMPR